MSNYKIKDLDGNNIQDIATIHRLSRIESERGIIRDQDLDRNNQDWFESKWQQWHQDPEIFTKTAIVRDVPVGFVSYGRIKTRPSFDQGVVPRYGGEIYAIYVHPDHFHHGIGTQLFKVACSDLADKKLTSVLLWVLKKNKRACAFYDAMGGERIAKQRVDIGETSWAEESCFGWRDVRKLGMVNHGYR
jgi:ribosomal protein S18 acetylase RimI-like enzyme